MNLSELDQIANLRVYSTSICEAGEATYFLGKGGIEKLVGCVGEPCLPNAKMVGDWQGRCVCVGPLDALNAVALRAALPWTAPRCIGLATSAGFGDRLGLATPAHVRAIRGSGIAPVFAQQSIREMTRTARSPQEVIDAATWGVFQEGFQDGFGADADHVHNPEDLAPAVAAGFTMFTIDPGPQVRTGADHMDAADLTRHFEADCREVLETTPEDLKLRYEGKKFDLALGARIEFSAETLLRAAVKYGRAVAHTAMMFRRLVEIAAAPFELEVSVDETDSPTSPEEHYFIACELERMGVLWVSLAPRFPGRFEKGIEYIGDLEDFRRSFELHVAVMSTLGPYKLSIHSGSDKFALYPIIAELAGGMVHLKTAGTSYVEALRGVAAIEPDLFRRILSFARGCYEKDKASYLVSADLAKVPDAGALADAELPALLDDRHVRQVLHVTFGSVLQAGGGKEFGKPVRAALMRDEETYYGLLQRHIERHAQPFRKP